jgi:DNA end-binding protein Ku
MGRTDRAALGRFVMRTKEYRAIVRARDGALSLTTMRMHDEVRPLSGVDTGAKGKPPAKQLDAALGLVEAMTVEWDPARYEDRYRKRLQKVVADKRKGKTIKAPERVDEPSPVPDLMEALRASLEAARGERGGADGLEDLSRDELYERAQDAGVPGRSSMSKKELIEALS